MQPEALVLVGIPGCGKSTYAEMFKTFYGYEIVERDMVRLQTQKEYGLQPITDTRVDYSKWNWEWPNEEIATDKHHALIKNFSNKLKSIVISDVNLSYRYDLVGFLRKLGYKIKVQYLYTPLEICLQRNEKREYPVYDGVIIGHHKYFMEQLQKEIPYDKEPTIVICHSCEETKHLAEFIPPEHFVIRYYYNDIVWDVYRKHKDVVDAIINDNEYRKHKEIVDAILKDEKTLNETHNEQTLLQNTELETFFIRINNKELKSKLMNILLTYNSFENTLTKLLKQNYNLYKKGGMNLNDFHILTSPQIAINILYHNNHQYLEQKSYIENKYRFNILWQTLKDTSQKLNSHNLTYIIQRVEANFNLYIKNLLEKYYQNLFIEESEHPDLNELSINGYSVELDKHNSLSLERLKDNLIGIRLSKDVIYININKEQVKNLADINNIHSIKVVYDDGDLYLEISYIKIKNKEEFHELLNILKK